MRRIGGRTFRELLGPESEQWVADGLITAEQAAALRSRYDGEGPRAELRSRAASVLAVIGATAVGLGVLGFVAANWSAISHGLRLALLTAVVAGAYAGAYHLRERTGSHPRVGEALYLLGLLVFGASLFLVGQMYNVEAHDPLALLIWAAAAVAVAILVRSPPLTWAALLIFSGWIAFEAGTAVDDASGDNVAALPAVAVFYGGALYGLGTAAQTRIRAAWFADTGFAPAARRLGLLLAVSGLFVFTFAGATDELGDSTDELSGAFEAGLLVLVVFALAGAAALALSERPSARYEAGALTVAVGTLLVAAYAGGSGDLYALLFNLLVAAVALGTIYVGYVSEEPWLVNFGVVLVAADLIARYFDFFWSALPRSVGMIGAGILVLGIAFVLERQRKQLLTRMDA